MGGSKTLPLPPPPPPPPLFIIKSAANPDSLLDDAEMKTLIPQGCSLRMGLVLQYKVSDVPTRMRLKLRRKTKATSFITWPTRLWFFGGRTLAKPCSENAPIDTASKEI
jgi:hypothetical protein